MIPKVGWLCEMKKAINKPLPIYGFYLGSPKVLAGSGYVWLGLVMSGGNYYLVQLIVVLLFLVLQQAILFLSFLDLHRMGVGN